METPKKRISDRTTAIRKVFAVIVLTTLLLCLPLRVFAMDTPWVPLSPDGGDPAATGSRESEGTTASEPAQTVGTSPREEETKDGTAGENAGTNGGCASSVGIGALVSLLSLAAPAFLRKKES